MPLRKLLPALVLLLLAPRAAWSQAAQGRVALLEMRLHGLSPDARGRFLQMLSEKLTDLGYEVIGAEVARRELAAAGTPPGCTVGPCLAEVGRVLRTQQVVVGSVVAVGSNYDVTLSLLDTHGGSLLAQGTERCEICTLDEGLHAMSRAAAQLGQRHGPLPPEPARVEPEKTALAPAPPPAPPPAPNPGAPAPPEQSRVLRWVVASLAVAAIATGITLLALDGSCSENARVPGGTCPSVYNTSGLAIGFFAGGIVLGGGAAWLFYASHSSGAGGVAMGVGARF